MTKEDYDEPSIKLLDDGVTMLYTIVLWEYAHR
jgi:hypothetical protein